MPDDATREQTLDALAADIGGNGSSGSWGGSSTHSSASGGGTAAAESPGTAFDPSDLTSALADMRGVSVAEIAEDKCMPGGRSAENKGAKGRSCDTKGAKGSGSSIQRLRQQARLEKQKSSSTSTVYMSSTISVPDVDRIRECDRRPPPIPQHTRLTAPRLTVSYSLHPLVRSDVHGDPPPEDDCGCGSRANGRTG